MVPDRSSLSRREYVRALVATGGAGALGLSGRGRRRRGHSGPSGTDDPDSLPDRQHAWNDTPRATTTGTCSFRNTTRSSRLLRAEPNEEDRDTVEAAFRTIERAYEWSNEGLVFTVGYTPAYFARYDGSLPDSVDLPEPVALTDREDPAFDEYDALLHLASDRPEVVPEAEEALFGDRETVNGVDLEADLSGVFDRREDHRRTGFVGDGLPARHTDLLTSPNRSTRKRRFHGLSIRVPGESGN